MKKRILAIALVVLMLLSVGVLFVRADDDGIEVYVTISDKDGNLAIAAEKVTVTDVDNDGKLTIADALYIAHEQFYDGGAAAGFATETTKYGLSLTKLWGHADGYNYSYMHNNASAWELGEVIQDGDYISAYCYTDTKTFSDQYTYFDELFVEPEDDQVQLTLTGMEYDYEGTLHLVPIANAAITIDGKDSGFVTDADGKVTLTFEKNGEFLISATAADRNLVHPVCIVTISYFDESTPDEAVPAVNGSVTDDPEASASGAIGAPASTESADKATDDSATKDTATKDSSVSGTSPRTGDVTHLWLWVLISAGCLCGIVCVAVFYVKRYGKK